MCTEIVLASPVLTASENTPASIFKGVTKDSGPLEKKPVDKLWLNMVYRG